MSNRICFKSKNNEDITTLELPELIGAGNEFSEPFYEAERNLIFTYIKTIEFYGDRLHGIVPTKEFVDNVKRWAKENNLVITTDYDEIIG